MADPLYNGIRARQIDTVGLQSDYTGTGTGPEHDPGAPWFATDCGQTNCGREPVLGRLIDFLQDGTPVYGVTEACRVWLFGGTPGYVHEADWPPFGISRFVKVRLSGNATCGRINGDQYLAYDEITDTWNNGDPPSLAMSVSAGVISFLVAGCVDPGQIFTFTKDSPEVCVYPLNISPVATLDDDETTVSCCDCDSDADDPAQLHRVHVHGFHPAVHAARLVDVVGGVERWQVATDCCPPPPIPCCCFDGDQFPVYDLVVEVIADDPAAGCPVAIGVTGSLAWLADPPWDPGYGVYIGGFELCGDLVELMIDCQGSTSEWGAYRLRYNKHYKDGTEDFPGGPQNWGLYGNALPGGDGPDPRSGCVPFDVRFGWLHDSGSSDLRLQNDNFFQVPFLPGGSDPCCDSSLGGLVLKVTRADGQ